MKRLLLCIALLAGMATVFSSPAVAQSPGDEGSVVAPLPSLPPVPIASPRLDGVRLMRPRDEAIVRTLVRAGKLRPDAPQAVKDAAIEEFWRGFAKKSLTWASPRAKGWAEEREAAMAAASFGPQAIQAVSATVFALAVDFGGTDDISYSGSDGGGGCTTVNTTVSGPLKGNIPHPGVLDNATVWYEASQTADAAFYEKLIFGYEGVGRIRSDLNDPVDGLPGINLAGYTVQDYYDHVAGEGNVTITGSVQNWVTVDHAEGYYGAPNCATGNSDSGAGVPVAQLVIDAVDEFNLAHPGFDWPAYDQDGDGIVDTFWIIHAGMGEEAGGGTQGETAIWAHSSDLRYYSAWPNGYKVYEGAPGTADDIYIGPYTMQPENLDLGVLCEEFGHNFFDLPDLYTTDVQNSVGFWSIMSAGAWGGYLAGSVPVGMPLWFRMIARCGDNACNWQLPMATRAYNAPTGNVTIGQLEGPPANTQKGVRVNLPPVQDTFANLAGSGKCAWSDTGRDGVSLTLDREIAVPASGGGDSQILLTFDSFWNIEEGWDYGYVEILYGGGTNILDDLDGVLSHANPNGNNLGTGLTGTSSAKTTLRFKLDKWAGETVTLRFLYKTDTSITGAGWWIDNVALEGTSIDDFTSAVAPGTFPGWSNSSPGWKVAPMTKSYENYYLLEWRNKTKYDSMVATAYVTTYADETTWQVARVPYTIPGALLYYRNAKYSSGYSLFPAMEDAPSYGPKHALLVVDMNYRPLRLGNTEDYLNSRAGSYDAALTTADYPYFQLPSVYGYPGGPWNFAAKPRVRLFDDRLGYYAGFYVDDPCPTGYACYSNLGGSAVIPAKGIYTTRVTHFDGTPYPEYYGSTLGDLTLGTGNPVSDNLQYGVRVLLASAAADGTKGTLRFNPPYKADLTVTSGSGSTKAKRGTQIYVKYYVENLGFAKAAASKTGIYLSKDQTISPAVDTLLMIVSEAPLAQGGKRYKKVHPRIPAGTAPGYYWIGIVADATKAVAESSETNNTLRLATRIQIMP